MRAKTDSERWLSLDTAGNLLGLDSRTVRRLVKGREIAGLQLRGGRFLISRAACLNFMRRLGEAIPDNDAGEVNA